MKDHICFSDKTIISHEILAYLAEHPDAADTLEGIAEWWLLDRKVRQQKAKVRRALQELTTKGYVLEEMSGDSRCRFRVNGSKIKEIRSYLDKRRTDSAEDLDCTCG